MKQLILTIVSVIALSFVSSSQKWKLVWSDEFNYKGLPDSTKWTGEVGGHGWGNNEAQFYTGIRKENARVENGKLIIEARKENWEGKNYTSARLITKNKGDWQYGKIEVKAKIPKGRGTWPAIWMLGSTTPLKWPDDGEIDIMEHVGFHQGYIHASIHCKKYNHVIGTQKTDTTYLKDCSEKFHIYGVEWSKDSVKISVDHKVYFSFANEHSSYDAWPFDNKMFLILNIAVGGNWGGQKGIDEKIWPQKMEIDYVRVWQKK
ncbi:MAG: glycoside hydrolase family 16 protein [Sphingobacteriales bacterium]|nr:MAG: glycoside hydrolase family 16 protein [Sphingobacteriales bacterium]